MNEKIKEHTGEETLTDENLDEAMGGFDWEKPDWEKMIELFKSHGMVCPYCGGDDPDRLGYGPEGYHLYECGDCGKHYLLMH